MTSLALKIAEVRLVSIIVSSIVIVWAFGRGSDSAMGCKIILLWVE